MTDACSRVRPNSQPKGGALRVLHVTPYFAPAFRYGGPPRSVLGLCKGLQHVGVDVEVFTTTANGEVELPASPATGDRYDGVPVRYFPLRIPRRVFGVRGLGGQLDLQLQRCDVVHTHGLWTLPVWTAARRARRAGVPVVISPRGMLDAWSMKHRATRKRIAYWLVERQRLASAAFVHATSCTEAEAIQSWSHEAPVVTLPNGVEMPDLRSLSRGGFQRRLKLPLDAQLVVFLGRLHIKKRLDLLASAFDRIRVAHPRAHLVIAGPDEGGYRRRMEPLFAGAGESVHWTGQLDDSEKWSLFGDAAALVMCSESENFGLAVLESMAAGVPVVVTKTCPWAEVQVADCGFWVPQDVEAIAEALSRLLSHPEGARAMGERGMALARGKYSWERIATQMAEHYRSVLTDRVLTQSVL
jgi:glycosyltransferase involved in cell wall biosynthesis